MKIKAIFSTLKSICCIGTNKDCISSVCCDISKYRHRPNKAPFTLDLTPRAFMNSDAFIKQDLKNIEYARNVNYRYN